MQLPTLRESEGMRRKTRMDLRLPKRLVYVDIPKAGYYLLIEQQRLHPCFPLSGESVEHLWREIMRERFNTEIPNNALRRSAKIHSSKLTRVIEPKTLPVTQIKHDAIVSSVLGGA